MRRTPFLLISFGLGMVMIGLTFLTLTMNAAPAVQATLPDDHPPLNAPASIQGGLPLLSTTTRLDFFQPGTQPNVITGSTNTIDPPSECTGCHSGYSAFMNQPQPSEYEPWTGWAGSMMSQSGRDPIFLAALDIANADAAFAGEFCLRCHMPRGWLHGRSGAVDGSAMDDDDREGVQCEVCHRLVDPVYSAENPARDLEILAAITTSLNVTGNATLVVDTEDYRRGPFDVVTGFPAGDPHTFVAAEGTLESPFHQEAALCGRCHDISNPLFTWNPISQTYALNAVNVPYTDTTKMFPIERTYSEWFLSDYNSPGGVEAPQFGGNKTHVATCQDCHMRDVTGKAAAFFSDPTIVPERPDLPLHDLTGANTWVPQIIPLHPDFSDLFTNSRARADALEMGIDRATYMLQNAAVMDAVLDGNQLTVTITNQSGHKLPTGYVEGRRMWIQVEAYDITGTLVYSSGAYNNDTGVLTADPDLKVYESKHGLTADLANDLGLSAGASFHFALNNVIVTDNRIPPRGYAFDAFNAAGAAPHANSLPDATLYADGQYWDTTTYTLPVGVEYVTVRLLHQVASKEYVEFLRDNNPNSGDPNNNGQILYDLWFETNRSAPTIMAERTVGLEVYLPLVQKETP